MYSCPTGTVVPSSRYRYNSKFEWEKYSPLYSGALTAFTAENELLPFLHSFRIQNLAPDVSVQRRSQNYIGMDGELENWLQLERASTGTVLTVSTLPTKRTSTMI
jgi:hypothetical protein